MAKTKNNLMLWGLLGGAALFIFTKRNTRTPAQNRALYQPAFKAATKKYNLPPGMVERVAQQESAFRSDIIHGGPNQAGAIGLMQIVPRWHPNVNPRDPLASIDYGAKYLRELYNQFGEWRLALMAYNWGPGNVKKLLAGADITVPRETKNYERQILADVNV